MGSLPGWYRDERDDGRIVVSVDDESETFEFQAEIPEIEGYALEGLESLPGGDVAGDDAEGGEYLH